MTRSGSTLAVLLLSWMLLAAPAQAGPPQVILSQVILSQIILAQVINGESTYENNYLHMPPPGQTTPATSRSDARDATLGREPAAPDAAPRTPATDPRIMVDRPLGN